MTDVTAADRDRPDAYLPGDRRRAIAAGRDLPDRVRGAALFADISGFTPLTEALAIELGPQRAAEELTRHLDRICTAIIDDVDRYGGDVIYFAGDAITCWLDGDDGTRAAACGLAMQATMREIGAIRTPGGQDVVLAIKVSVAVGEARRFVVGDPDVQLIDVLAGRLIDELAEAEHLAEKGDVVLAASAMAALGLRVEVGELRADGAMTVGVLVGLREPVAEFEPLLATPVALREDQVRPWSLPEVYERLVAGRGEFLAELRTACPMFVRFGGIDFDGDPQATAQLDDFVRRVQHVVRDYGGNLLQLTLGDKGAYLYITFGAPLAHEDDAVRAATAALDLLLLERECAVVDLQVGITTGRLRSGTTGHPFRRTFTCLGDMTNLAARLMSRAPAGQVYVSDELHRALGDRLRCESVGELAVKGKALPVHVWRVVERASGNVRREIRYPLPMVGRDGELAAIAASRDAALAGRGQVVGIAAEAGRGKSRLVAEVVRGLRGEGITVAWGEAQRIGASTSYLAWREVWRGLFGLGEGDDDDAPDAVLQRRTVDHVLRSISADHARRAPLLAPVLGIDLPDNDVTRSFDAKLRKTSLESLLVDVLRWRAAQGPVTIVLEDCHWLDPLSRELLVELVRTAASLPVLFLLAYRPAASPGGGLGLEGFPFVRELVLAELGPAAAGQVLAAKVAQLFGEGATVTPALAGLVETRAQGNPFYIEEILNYVHDRHIDPADATALATVDLPDSLQRLVLSRIDLLAEEPRRTLKVASVVGRSFDTPFVRGAYPDLGTEDVIDEQLTMARRAELVVVDRVEDRSWLFRHVITRDVAYESLPFAMRAHLHEQIGRFLESRGEHSAERDLDLLAHHWWHGEDEAKKREYVVRAGMAAQARYANEVAVDWYCRALTVVDDVERVGVLRRLGKVLELGGEWAQAEATFSEAIELAATVDHATELGRARTELADVWRKQGRFDDARAELARARDVLTGAGDRAGIGQVLHLEGTLASQQGRYDEARAHYEASLAIREELDDRAGVGSLLSNLALVAENEGDLTLARALNERALAVREAVGDRWALCVSNNNLGMVALLQHDLDEARQRFEAAMRLAVEIGDRWMVAVGHHNLGNALVGLRRLARAGTELLAAWEAYETYGDEWSMMLLIEDLVPLAAAAGHSDVAFELVGVADGMRDRLAAPRPPSIVAVLDEALAPLRTDPALRESALVGRGRSWDGDAVRRSVHKFCASTLLPD